ncbi:MAG: D-glycerate dehydrogenase [Pseudomonadota bacterium]
MSDQRLKVIVTRRLPVQVELRLKELFDTELNDSDTPLTHEQLIDAAGRADVLVSTVTDKVDEAVLRAGEGRLRMIAQFGAGVDNIDIDKATALGIMITNTQGVLTDDTADVTMMLILSLPRRIREGVQLMLDGKFDGWAPTWMMGHRLTGKRLGIIGMGRIGQAVARRAKVFGLQVHYHNRKPVVRHIEEELEATYWDSLDQMLAHTDILTIHCPHTPATYHLLSARRLALMKPEAFIINTARGEVIDEAALAAAILDGKIAGAGLDVFERGPTVTPELIGQPNVLLLPHMGSATIEGRIEMGEKVIINIKTFADGHRPPDRVIPNTF